MELEIRRLKDKEEMLSCFSVVRELYPSMQIEEYSQQLDLMLPHNYFQAGVFHKEKCIGISGVWIGHKLWCGKYLEVDHIVILEKERSNGIGKGLMDFLKEWAREEQCTSIGLDSFTYNTASHKFFFKEGFHIKGYHFVHELDGPAK